MDLEDQLRKLFPDHQPEEPKADVVPENTVWIQDDPILCKYEKRKGKPITIIDGYNGATEDFKQLAKELKQLLSVGGSFKNEQIIIQGDYRDKIMDFLKDKGFKVKMKPRSFAEETCLPVLLSDPISPLKEISSSKRCSYTVKSLVKTTFTV